MIAMHERLEELRKEFGKGQHRLEALEREAQDVRNTLLRISGAIQVLEELLAAEDVPANGHTAEPVMLEAAA